MQIVHWGKARKFYKNHPLAEHPLKQWRQAVQGADWKNFSDVRKTFSSADWVEGKIVFNIKGNYFRLVAITAFSNGKLYVKRILTHEEYEKTNWKS